MIDPVTVGMAAAGATLVGVFLWRRRRRDKLTPTDLSVLENVPEGRLHIRELAQIWLRYNDRLIEGMVKEVVEPPQSNSESLAFDSLGSTPSSKSSPEEGGLFEKYDSLLEAQNVLCTAKSALKLLAEHPGVSSVSSEMDDPENLDLRSYRDTLAKISLKEHTLRVVTEAVKLAEAEFHDPEPHLPRIIIAALYHDLGKIPGFAQLHGTRDHAAISAQVLLEEAKKCNESPFWLEDASRMVREHHFPGSGDSFTQILRRADQSARAKEVAEVMSDFTSKPFDEWFDAGEFMESLYDYVNREQKAGKWIAFTHQGVIYVKSEGLVMVADEIRLKRKVLSPEFLFDGERKRLALKIANKLSESGLVLNPDRPLQKYVIVNRDGRRFTVMLVALKVERYPDDKRKELELRKQASYFHLIAAVKPA